MRIFTAVDIPDEIKERIYNVSRSFSFPGVSIVRKEKFHITLHFLGEVEEQKINQLGKGLKEAIKAKQFEVEICGLGYFDPKVLRVIFAKITKGEEELKSLHEQTSDFLIKEGFKVEKTYVPHLTIAKVRSSQERQRLIQLINQNSTIEFGSFTATSLKLKNSKYTQNGMVYEDLLEFDL